MNYLRKVKYRKVKIYVYLCIYYFVIYCCVYEFIKGENIDIKYVYGKIYVVLGCIKFMDFLLLNLILIFKKNIKNIFII